MSSCPLILVEAGDAAEAGGESIFKETARTNKRVRGMNNDQDGPHRIPAQDDASFEAPSIVFRAASLLVRHVDACHTETTMKEVKEEAKR